MFIWLWPPLLLTMMYEAPTPHMLVLLKTEAAKFGINIMFHWILVLIKTIACYNNYTYRISLIALVVTILSLISFIQNWAFKWIPVQTCSFTSNLGIEAAKADCKSLKCWDGVPVIHCKQIFSNLSKLEDYLLVFWSCRPIFWGSHQLKIFNWSNCHSSMEV